MAVQTYADRGAIQDTGYDRFEAAKYQNQLIDQALQENKDREDRFQEKQRRKLQDEEQSLRVAKLKEDQLSGLIIPADTGVKSADQYIQQTSRALVDQQAALVNQMKNGEISTDEFAHQSALIKSQVPALAAAKPALEQFQSTYQTLLQNKSISGADDGQAGYLYDSIQNGTMNIVPDESGNLVITGEYQMPGSDETSPISIPLSQLNRMPQPTPKAAPMSELIAPALTALGDAQWSPEVEESVQQSIDQAISDDDGTGRNLKAIAVDNLGMTMQQANELYATEVDSDTGATNALEEAIEKNMMNSVKVKHDAQLIDRQKAEADLAYKQAMTDRAKREASQGNQNGYNQTVAEMNMANDQKKFINMSNIVSQAEKIQDPTAAAAMINQSLGGQFVEYQETEDDRSWYQRPFKDAPTGGQFVVFDTKGNPIGAAASVAEAKMMFANAIGIKNAVNYSQSPVNKNSPLNKSRGARKSAQNAKTKAAHAQAVKDRHAEWDDQRENEDIGWGDIATSAAGALPYAGALAGAGKAAKLVKGASKAVFGNKSTFLKGAAGAVSDQLGSAVGEQDLTNIAAGGVQGGAVGAAKGYVKGKLKDKAKGVVKKGLKAALGNAGDIAGFVGKGVGIAGTAKAAYDTAKLANQMQRQNMSDEEYANFKRTGSTTGSRRGRNSRGRRS